MPITLVSKEQST